MQADKADLSTVGRLTAMGGSPVAVEALRDSVSVEPERLDVPDAGGRQPRRDIGFQIKMRLAGRAFNKKPFIVRNIADQEIAEAGVDLIIADGNGRADGGRNTLSSCAQVLHRRDCRLVYAGQGPPRAGGGRAGD